MYMYYVNDLNIPGTCKLLSSHLQMYVISFPKAVTASNRKPAINVLLVNMQIVFFGDENCWF